MKILNSKSKYKYKLKSYTLHIHNALMLNNVNNNITKYK